MCKVLESALEGKRGHAAKLSHRASSQRHPQKWAQAPEPMFESLWAYDGGENAALADTWPLSWVYAPGRRLRIWRPGESRSHRTIKSATPVIGIISPSQMRQPSWLMEGAANAPIKPSFRFKKRSRSPSAASRTSNGERPRRSAAEYLRHFRTRLVRTIRS